jgi:hypothetical protein
MGKTIVEVYHLTKQIMGLWSLLTRPINPEQTLLIDRTHLQLQEETALKINRRPPLLTREIVATVADRRIDRVLTTENQNGLPQLRIQRNMAQAREIGVLE